ncbi:MAG: type IV pilus modification protein PilV [Burkholderiaceae bacterium]
MNPHHQIGASLIEVLVALLLLSFGMLSLGATLSFSVQMPKLSGYRATAVNLASNYVERMRANPTGLPGYRDVPISYDGTQDAPTAATICTYPSCDSADLVTMDSGEMQVAVRRELPAGGIVVSCDESSCSNGIGNLWVMWQQPDTFAALDPSSSDNCPAAVAKSDPKPRCLYVRFKL